MNKISEEEIIIDMGVRGFNDNYNGYQWIEVTDQGDQMRGERRFIRGPKIIQWGDLVRELGGSE